MKAVVSTTYDDKYLFFIPIVTFCWNKLGVDVICFHPANNTTEKQQKKFQLIIDTRNSIGQQLKFYSFGCREHKEATYAQCARLYAGCLDLPEDEILITSDADMILFKIPQNAGSNIAIFGSDLVPHEQVPICYISAEAKEWRRIFKLNGKSYQQCLDDLLGHIEADHFRGNYWGKDQEEAYNNIFQGGGHAVLLPRARPGTQFASNRLDRDDAYLLERLNPDIIDYHLPRPGYEENNFRQIMTVLKYFYPNDDLVWIENYRDEYIKLL